jgi:hypothetical protein
MPCRFLPVLGRRVPQTGRIPGQRDKRDAPLGTRLFECQLVEGKYEHPCGLSRRRLPDAVRRDLHGVIRSLDQVGLGRYPNRTRTTAYGAKRKCRGGSVPAAIGDIPEKSCSPRVLLAVNRSSHLQGPRDRSYLHVRRNSAETSPKPTVDNGLHWLVDGSRGICIAAHQTTL